jgi:hypothetical protein
MSNLASALVIPDSLLAKEATGVLREHSTDLLFNHSIRVYLFAAEQGRQTDLEQLSGWQNCWSRSQSGLAGDCDVRNSKM